MAYGYATPFTIQSGQVTGTLTDFAALIALSGTQFKSKANGGRIINSDTGKPADFAVYSSPDLASANKIPHEIAIPWDAVAGTLSLFIKVPSCAVGTIVYIAYGDATVTTSQDNPTGVWDANFIGVYHMSSDNTTISAADSTGLHAGTNAGATFGTGQIDGGAVMDGATGHINATYASDLSGSFTFSAWAKISAFAGFPNYQEVAVSEVASYSNYYISFGTGGTAGVPTWTIAMFDGSNNPFAFETGTPNVFQHLAGVRDNTGHTLQMFVNGVSANGTVSDITVSTPTYSDFNIGRKQNGTTHYPLSGVIDEVRISKTVRSAAWILADYNSQVAPTSFWSQGAEYRVSRNTRIRPLGMRRGMSRFISFPA